MTNHLGATKDVSREFSTLVELLRLRATEHPELNAYTFLIDGEQDEVGLTFRELDEQARSIAAHLRATVSPGDRVLLLYPPGLEFIAAFFGCLYAGAIAIPAYPPRQNRNLQRIESILRDAQAAMALTTASVASRLGAAIESLPELLQVNLLATDTLPLAADEWVGSSLTGESLAFLQYTSGSTGQPKGVMLSHRNLLHNAALVHHAVEHTRADKYVSWLPTFHDMGFMSGVLQPLYAGIPVVLMSPASFLQRPLRWLQAISQHRATISGAPNFAYELCARKIGREDLAGLDLSSWSVAFNGAEPIRAATIESFAATFAACGFRRETFYPCYGLAEATLMVSGSRKAAAPVLKSFREKELGQGRAVEINDGEENARPLVGCGRTLLEQKIVIVEAETRRACATGEVGEIWVAGASVASGYWNRAEETRHTFGAQLAGTDEGPFLRTGDLGFMQESGELFVTGRLKDLIIIRGLNHYPQDIELTVERSHPALRAGGGAAFSLEIGGEERLVVVQEVEPRGRADLSAVAALVRENVGASHELQTYAVVFIKAGSLPKTSSGKVMRHACLAAYRGGTLDELFRSELDESVTERSVSHLTRDELLNMNSGHRVAALTAHLREQVSELLHVPSTFSPAQTLTSLGIDSLSSVELKHRLETDFGADVSLSSLLQDCSIEGLTRLVLQQVETEMSAEVARVLPPRDDARAQESPLSHVQQALWFLHSIAPESAAYNVALAARLSVAPDIPALRRAFQTLVDRHSSLRTTYTTRDGEPVQRVHPHVPLQFAEVDAATLGAVEFDELLNEEANKPFDLEREPVFRVKLFHRPSGEHVLLLTVHHIAIDGWSLWVLLDELRTLYAAETKGGGGALTPPRAQYTDYVRWQEELLASRRGEELAAYWQSELGDDLPPLNLPARGNWSPQPGDRGASLSFSLNDELVRRLQHVARDAGVTLYVVLLTAFQILLQRYTGEDDIAVGSPATGRSRAEFEGVVGCFMNPVGVRLDLSGDASFKVLLRRVHQKVLAALEHQDYPSQLIAEQHRTDRLPGALALFPVMFIMQKAHRQTPAISFARRESQGRLEPSELSLDIIPLERRFARSALELELLEMPGSLKGWLHYNADLYDAWLIEQMATHFQVLLEAVAASPDESIRTLRILTDAERERLIYQWSNVSAERRSPLTVLDLFQQQMGKNADKPVAIQRQRSLTFRELDEGADRLADLIMELQK